jgi:L-histidine N-alpha-methyltransferase
LGSEADILTAEAPLREDGYDVLELAYDVMDGLTRPFKELSSRFLYDERGAELFEQILELPEYYQGRTEMSLLERHAQSIIRATAPTEVVDVGAGSGAKTKLLLQEWDDPAGLTYIPVDMSTDMLDICAGMAAESLPGLAVEPVQSDFSKLLDTLGVPPHDTKRLVVMLGGTIGNLLPGARRRFWRELGAIAGGGGALLVGIDLAKDPRASEAAYDDAAGVTAEFNKNLLQTLNIRLGADFDLGAFDHVVVYDDANSWVEMRLRARRRCKVRVELLDWEVEFYPGEEIRTEVSAKYMRASFEHEIGWAGLGVKDWLADAEERFALVVLTA